MNDLIEKLKHNKTAWKWLSDEEKNCVQGVPSVNRARLDMSGHWQKARQHLWPNDVVRIHEDYKPEPEIEWREVEKKDASIRYQHGTCWWPIQAVYEEPLWTGLVKYADGTISHGGLRRVDTGNPNGPAEYPTHVGFTKE